LSAGWNLERHARRKSDGRIPPRSRGGGGQLNTMPGIVSSMCPKSDHFGVDLDVDAIIATLEGYPVRYAVLYGSHADGVATSDSDVDIAVAFTEKLSESDRLNCRIELVVDLMETLGTNDVDLADLDTIRPEVGLQAIETGRPLLGDEGTRQEYRKRFERDASTMDTHEERMRDFDALLRRLEETV